MTILSHNTGSAILFFGTFVIEGIGDIDLSEKSKFARNRSLFESGLEIGKAVTPASKVYPKEDSSRNNLRWKSIVINVEKST